MKIDDDDDVDDDDGVGGGGGGGGVGAVVGRRGRIRCIMGDVQEWRIRD